MKQVQLKMGEGPYTMSYLGLNSETNELEDKALIFNVRAYGEDNNKPSVFLISEHHNNTGGDIQIGIAKIADKLREAYGYEGVYGLHFFVHYPENVHENGPERFREAIVRYDQNGPYLHHTSRDVSSEHIASVIGQENIQAGYLAAPHKSHNPLVSQAFESGLADTQNESHNNNPSIELD